MVVVGVENWLLGISKIPECIGRDVGNKKVTVEPQQGKQLVIHQLDVYHELS